MDLKNVIQNVILGNAIWMEGVFALIASQRKWMIVKVSLILFLCLANALYTA